MGTSTLLQQRLRYRILDRVVYNPEMSHAITPFNIAVPQTELDDLYQRLSSMRWPEPATVDDWSQGVPLRELRALCDYWQSGYDWRPCEAWLNSCSSARTVIEGVGIHFLHIRSPEADAMPLVMTHGWPGSVVEFRKVVGPLTDPAAHGGNRGDAFHLVLPTLPGFGFSDKPTRRGWGLEKIGVAWTELVRRLGYADRWAAQGGDWGAGVARAIAAQQPPGCVGIHLNMVDVVPTPAEILVADEKEKAIIAGMDRYKQELSGYAKEQQTRPQTLGYALADSPVGQAAWIYEKFNDWTDNTTGPESVLTRDEMLDNIMMYWLTNSGASSARIYQESFDKVAALPILTLPAALSVFPKDISRTSRRWAERRFAKLVHFNELDRGGHFAAFEQPGLFVDEVRAGFRTLR